MSDDFKKLRDTILAVKEKHGHAAAAELIREKMGLKFLADASLFPENYPDWQAAAEALLALDAPPMPHTTVEQLIDALSVLEPGTKLVIIDGSGMPSSLDLRPAVLPVPWAGEKAIVITYGG